MDHYLFKSPLDNKDVKDFVRKNKSAFLNKTSESEESFIYEHRELWPLIENLTIADKARFWRLLKEEVINLNKKNDIRPAYLNAKEIDQAAKSAKKPLSPNAIANLIVAGIFLVIIVFVLLIFKSCSDRNNSPEAQARHLELDQQTQAILVMESYLKDGDSAQFHNQHGYCGQVNAKNGFGAYTGLRRYIVLGGKLPVIEGENEITSGQFQEMWIRNC